jgi:CheY-like chemotaxis protein
MYHSPRILVVDDNEASAKVFALVLSLDGYDVRECYSGKQAIEVSRSFLPDVAFLDLGVPLMDGYDIADGLRAIPQLRDITLFAVTGYSGEEHVARTRAAGFRRHIVKPVEPEVILRLLKECGFPAPKPSQSPTRNERGSNAILR